MSQLLKGYFLAILAISWQLQKKKRFALYFDETKMMQKTFDLIGPQRGHKGDIGDIPSNASQTSQRARPNKIQQ